MGMWMLAAVVATVALMLFQAAGALWVAAIALWIVVGYAGDVIDALAAAVLLVVLGAPAVLLASKSLRRSLVSPHLLALFKRILPSMSETERDALEAGTTWWDADLFSGKPDWNKLLSLPAPSLSDEEQAFLGNEVNQLCALVDDWESTQLWQGLSPQAWQFARDRGFLGMIIPKQYGGKQFSAYMHSQVVMKLSTRCSALAVQVMVPNSLGPAELLLHYGTDAQKDYYLPRLAAGTEVPCFALTSPYAGSDAAAIPDTGVVCMGQFEGRETLGLRVSWTKRYITLGPVATLLGLAFRAVDPDKLLPPGVEPGISCALIPTTHAGVVIGRRHWPLNAVFQNGPTSGSDVFIPMQWVIGGQPQIGKGWRMLMECLAAGRAISLPSASVGTAKLAVRGTSAYAAIRRQFKTAIGKFEGVQEALARMGGNLYMMDATRKLSALAVDLGEKPAVISAIAKYHVTERARAVVNDGMDVLGGKGICMGPSNFLARAYQQIPIAVTVEGANILTRCLIIFGQGAIRAHPYVLKEMHASTETDGRKALLDFDDAFFGHVGFVCANAARALCYGLTGALLKPEVRAAAEDMLRYYRAVDRLSTAFALMTDFAMFVLGGSLKRRERISARLGDILSQMYLISATLKRFEDDGRPQADAPYVHWSVQDALARAQNALIGVLDNFPNRALALALRLLVFPFGLPYREPSDALGGEVAEAMQTAGPGRERLLADCFVADDFGDPIACGELAFALLPQVEAIEHRFKPAVHSGALAAIPQSLVEMREWVADAAASGLITAEERHVLSDFARYADISIQVDDFSADLNAAADVGRRQAMTERRKEMAEA
ncbi:MULTISPECIES: acyl-CoA dehydrogenase [unclassified Janthinobacterium]|uniref:acyl-CoA dehydrogenase n=1 Tax=unclassified Janthinobacterium TaxID=2610881 RepID=UPI000345D703|nr:MULTISPECIES: acyl-CoA dehydrogenase [unclassified Janthinobacterium]MEC5160400.1 acyl-CoA dehydrogenase [Janthinobacterium sp. CG_S6]